MIEVRPQLCSGCRRCEIACDTKHGATPGRRTGRVWVLKDETTGADIPLVCRCCTDRPCAAACPTGALGEEVLACGSRVLKLTANLCTGCGQCASACPWGLIELSPERSSPWVCDGCGGEFACVRACNLGALLIAGQDGRPAGASGREEGAGVAAGSADPAAARRLSAARDAARRLPWLDKPGAPKPFDAAAARGAAVPGGAAGSAGEAAARRRPGWTGHAYAGKILRVDLDGPVIRSGQLEPELARAGLGGRGINSLRLLRELAPGTDPLSPANLLMIGVGPLTGSALAASGRFTVSARSPQTGYLGDGNAGGHFGPELKFAGFDQVVVCGRSPKPVYLLISDGEAQLRPAAHLWGLDVWATTDAVRRELGDWGLQVMAIGRPAELGVRYAGVVTGHARAAARTGMGAVMGSKNLKAVAVRGTLGHPPMADPHRFAALAAGIERRILDHPGFEKRMRLGTTALVSGLQSLGILPTRHFQTGQFEAFERVSGERLAAEYKVKHKSCFNCPVHCSRFYRLPDGTMAEGPEYETLCGFTSRIGNADLSFALRMAAQVNRHGLDSISLTEAIGWLMECAQRGLISACDVDGLDLEWGNRETIAAITDRVAHRRGAVGELLADGALAAARKLGRGSESLVMHVKGLDMICGDPRGIKAYGLTYAIASRGADHLRAEPFFELTGDRQLAEQRFGTPDAADRLAWRGKAALVNYSEEIALFTDALTMCKNVGLCMDILTHEGAAELLRAALGEDVTAGRLRLIAGGVLDAERIFNLREGLEPAADNLPERFLSEPLASGPSAGQVVEIDRMIGEYYRLRGWGPDGRPSEGKRQCAEDAIPDAYADDIC
ncbi:MAG: aldehyde ferredoxin oxidoreductase C-terminal domain-containing protein [Bacillota bacterium]|nr:aldehyde ferredoxin oxidoreductase C-terminal domain-containing protein [Bacillota bacterium]